MGIVQRSTYKILIAAAVVAVAGCGGGGGSPPTVGELKGFWSGPIGSSTGKAVSLGDGSIWIVEYSNLIPVAITKASWSTATGALQGSGRKVLVSTGVGSNASVALSTLQPKSSMTGGIDVTGSSSAFSWIYDVTGEGSVPASSLQGSWSGRFNDGAFVLNWDVLPTGKISGSSTKGCVYDGTLGSRMDGLRVVDLTVTETCNGTAKALTGIGTVHPNMEQVSFTYIGTDGSGAGVVRMTKQMQ